LGRAAVVDRPFAGRQAKQQVAILIRPQRREPEYVVDNSKIRFTRYNPHGVDKHLGAAYTAEPLYNNARETNSAAKNMVNARTFLRICEN
jgi:hypothetical protein